MKTFLIELFKAGEYEQTKKAFVISSTDRRSAARTAWNSGSFDHLNGFAGKAVPNKKADELVKDGAKDMRTPVVATVENRKRLGALVGM